MEPEEIERDVKSLAGQDGRRVGTPGHKAAREYIVSRLAELGVQGYEDGSYELPYKHDGQDFVNIAGRLPGADPALEPVLLGAHYDTCGDFPGADDNAAAVAVLLASVEALRERHLDRTVVLAFFDAEEPPHFMEPSMGSIHFYQKQRQEEIHCAIIMDLVGHDLPVPGMEDILFVLGMESDPNLANVIKSCEAVSPIRVVPTLNSYIDDLSDHHVFRVNQRPYLFLSCGHWEHYHQSTDTPEKLNYQKIAGVAEYLCRLTEGVCKEALDGPFEGYDTTETELFFLRRIVQPFLESMGLDFKLESRKDIDSLVGLMIASFGL